MGYYWGGEWHDEPEPTERVAERAAARARETGRTVTISTGSRSVTATPSGRVSSSGSGSSASRDQPPQASEKPKEQPQEKEETIKVYIGETSTGKPIYREVRVEDVQRMSKEELAQRYGSKAAENIRVEKTETGETRISYTSGVKKESYVSREFIERVTGKKYEGLGERVPLWQAKQILRQEGVKYKEEGDALVVEREPTALDKLAAAYEAARQSQPTAVERERLKTPPPDSHKALEETTKELPLVTHIHTPQPGTKEYLLLQQRREELREEYGEFTKAGLREGAIFAGGFALGGGLGVVATKAPLVARIAGGAVSAGATALYGKELIPLIKQKRYKQAGILTAEFALGGVGAYAGAKLFTPSSRVITEDYLVTRLQKLQRKQTEIAWREGDKIKITRGVEVIPTYITERAPFNPLTEGATEAIYKGRVYEYRVEVTPEGEKIVGASVKEKHIKLEPKQVQQARVIEQVEGKQGTYEYFITEEGGLLGTRITEQYTAHPRIERGDLVKIERDVVVARGRGRGGETKPYEPLEQKAKRHLPSDIGKRGAESLKVEGKPEEVTADRELLRRASESQRVEAVEEVVFRSKEEQPIVKVEPATRAPKPSRLPLLLGIPLSARFSIQVPGLRRKPRETTKPVETGTFKTKETVTERTKDMLRDLIRPKQKLAEKLTDTVVEVEETTTKVRERQRTKLGTDLIRTFLPAPPLPKPPSGRRKPRPRPEAPGKSKEQRSITLKVGGKRHRVKDVWRIGVNPKKLKEALFGRKR